MAIKATKLRQNLYQLLDEVLESGKALEIERNGKILKIIPEKATSKFDLLEPHSCLNGEAEDLLNLDWSKLWNEGPLAANKKKGKKR